MFDRWTALDTVSAMMMVEEQKKCWSKINKQCHVTVFDTNTHKQLPIRPDLPRNPTTIDKWTLQPQNQPRQIKQALYIPDGYVLSTGPNGEPLVVPEFLIPATHQAFAAYHKWAELRINNKARGVSVICHSIYSSAHAMVCLSRGRGWCRYYLPHRLVDSLTFL